MVLQVFASKQLAGLSYGIDYLTHSFLKNTEISSDMFNFKIEAKYQSEISADFKTIFITG